MSDVDISGPGELVQAVPYLFGSYPADSLVLIGTHKGRSRAASRLDLSRADIATVTESIAHLKSVGVEAVSAILYDSPTVRHVSAVQLAIQLVGVNLMDLLAVFGGRWRSVLCSNAACCSPGGRPIEASVSAYSAQAVFEGRSPARSREEFVALGGAT